MNDAQAELHAVLNETDQMDGREEHTKTAGEVHEREGTTAPDIQARNCH